MFIVSTAQPVVAAETLSWIMQFSIIVPMVVSWHEDGNSLRLFGC
jgi:hypothetical protein